MRRHDFRFLIGGLLFGALLSPAALAGPKGLTKPPAPLNKEVNYQVDEGTDIVELKYLATRQMFRVGHPPYQAARFSVAEFVLIADHTRKYLRPDLRAEIKLAKGHDQPELLASKSFQTKWKGLLDRYEKLLAGFKKIKLDKSCAAAHKLYLEAMENEIYLARKIAERMFANQQIRARELLREDLKKRFGNHGSDELDLLLAAFEENGNLSALYPPFVERFIEPDLQQAKALIEKVMEQVGVEYVVAVKEEEGEDKNVDVLDDE